MTVKTGMLPGDDFSLAEWKAAQGQPRTTPEELPVEVKLAYKELLVACRNAGVPMVAMFALKEGISTQYDLLDKPANVHSDMLTARATASGNIAHQLQLMAIALQGMDLSKLNGL